MIGLIVTHKHGYLLHLVTRRMLMVKKEVSNKNKTALGLFALLGVGVGAAILLSKRAPPQTEEQKCATKVGYHWDADTSTCVKNPTSEETCNATTGYHWDSSTSTCVKDATNEETCNATLGHHWDTDSGTCVLDNPDLPYICQYPETDGITKAFATLLGLQEHVASVHPGERMPIEIIWS